MAKQSGYEKEEKQKKREKIFWIIGKIIKTAFFVFLICLVINGANILIDMISDYRGLNFSGEEPVILTVESGDSAYRVANELTNLGVIKFPRLFRLIARTESLDTKLQVGTFTIEPGASYDDIYKTLKQTENYQYTIRLTFTEGMEVSQIFNKLVDNGIGSLDRYWQVASGWDFGYDFIPEVGTSNRLEGFMYPDTYDFYVNESEESVIQRFLDNFNKKIVNASVMSLCEVNGKNFYDVIIMASIVEKESQVASEQGRIASVFYNRISKKMRLQSDASVNYVKKLGERSASISSADMEIDSPYNTYKYYGITPTPIGNPTITAILAAVSPDNTNYLYFCSKADGTGSHEFAETFEEHQANVAKYLK